jgi:hypothetical protein
MGPLLTFSSHPFNPIGVQRGIRSLEPPLELGSRKMMAVARG